LKPKSGVIVDFGKCNPEKREGRMCAAISFMRTQSAQTDRWNERLDISTLDSAADAGRVRGFRRRAGKVETK